MTFPVLVLPSEGQYAATLVGTPEVRVVGPTRAEAIAAMRAEIAGRVQRGELVWLDVDTGGVTDLAGCFADDPTLHEICEEAYRLRDAELDK